MQTRSTVSGWLGPNFIKPEPGTLGWRIRREEDKEPDWYFLRELSDNKYRNTVRVLPPDSK